MVEKEKINDEKEKCPYCEKEYKAHINLVKHINKFHNSTDSKQVFVEKPSFYNEKKPNQILDLHKDKDEIYRLARDKIKDLDFTDWNITNEQLEQELIRIQSSKDSRIYRKAIIWYIYSAELRLSEFKDLEFIDDIIRVYGTNKAFILTSPIASFKGKPIYAIRDDFPISISLELHDYTNLVEKPMNPSEIDSIIFSSMFQKTFKQKRFDREFFIYLILTNVITGLIVYIIMSLSKYGVG